MFKKNKKSKPFEFPKAKRHWKIYRQESDGKLIIQWRDQTTPTKYIIAPLLSGMSDLYFALQFLKSYPNGFKFIYNNVTYSLFPLKCEYCGTSKDKDKCKACGNEENLPPRDLKQVVRIQSVY